MKNGEPRSAAWIKRHMAKYQVDKDSTYTCMLLVSEVHVPREAVNAWTDAQCMLAEDWAFAVHLSASDNNNRVPAMPEFLNQYRKVTSKTTFNPAEGWPFPKGN